MGSCCCEGSLVKKRGQNLKVGHCLTKQKDRIRQLRTVLLFPFFSLSGYLQFNPIDRRQFTVHYISTIFFHFTFFAER